MYKSAIGLMTLSLCLVFLSLPIAGSALDPTYLPVIESKPATPLRINSHFVQPDGRIIVGGSFDTIAGVLRRNIARLNPNGTADETFQVGIGVNEMVLAIARQSDGKIIIGGLFTAFNGIGRSYIARLNADGSLDPDFSPVLNNPVYEIVVQADGKILVGGEFSTVNGTPAQRLVRLESNGSIDPGFNISNSDVGNPVRAIALHGTKIVVGGEDLGFAGRKPLLRLDANGNTDGTFNIGSGIAGAVNDIAVQTDGNYLIGGAFNVFNGNAAPNNIARINANGTLDAGFSSGLSAFNEVRRIALQPDGKFLITGNFGFYGTTAVSGLARLVSNGNLDPTFTSGGLDGSLNNGLDVLPDGNILVSGNFTGYGTFVQPGIVRIGSNGTVDGSFAPRTGRVGIVSDMVEIGGGRMLIAGNFSFVNGVPREKIAVLLPNGAVDPSFDPGSGIVGIVSSVFRQNDNKFLIAGDFTTYNGVARENVARIEPNGSLDLTFNAGTMDSFDSIEDVAQATDGKVIVGGNLSGFNGTARNKIARLNSDGSLDTGFNSPFLGGNVFAILPLQDGKTYVGGSTFTTSQTFLRGIVRLNSDGTIDPTFNIGSGANGGVRSLARQPDGRLIIGGGFLNYNGTEYRGMARINPDGSLDNGFFPGSGVTGSVNELAIDNAGRVFIGGTMPAFDGIATGNLARLRGNGSFDQSLPVGTGSNRAVSAIALQSPAAVIIGCGTEFNGLPRGGLARIANSSAPVPNFDYDGDGRTDISIFRPTLGQWWLKRSSAGVVAATFGNPSDRIVPGDFTGDGKTDITVFRPSSGEWFVLRSENSTFYSFPFGVNGDTPVTGDFDADGVYDPGVFRPSNATWYVSRSQQGLLIRGFGLSGDIPVVGDYDGDRSADIAVFRPANGQWWIEQSSSGVIAHTFGNSTDKPVQGDWTGDGKTDVAIWRPSSGEWFVLRSEDFSFYSFPFGNTSDIPAPGDFDGNGRLDATVFRPATGTWYIATQTSGTLIEGFGAPGDIPTPSAFIP